MSIESMNREAAYDLERILDLTHERKARAEKNRRDTYGVNLDGRSGREVIWVRSRATADRIRRVRRAYAGFDGARTLRALADLAANRPGVHTPRILQEFEGAK